MWENGSGDGSNSHITCNSKPCWNLIFEKELGPALLVERELLHLWRGIVCNWEIYSVAFGMELSIQACESLA